MATEHNVFTKKHEEIMADDKRAVLEEMNLPPALVTFIRKNSKNLKIALALFILLVVSWEVYGEYRHRQQEKSSSLLYEAVQTENGDAKNQLLSDLIRDYSSSKSALWGKLELGHQAFQNSDYQGAVDKYQSVADALSTDNSLYPLVQFSLAQAYDSLEDNDKSEAAYQGLLNYPGFAAEGYLGLGRLAEKRGNPKKAVEMYESYTTLPDVQDGLSKDMVQYKISKLKAQE